MKKMFLSLAVMLTLTACPAPGTNSNGTTNNGTNNGTTNNGTPTVDANGKFATKADYIAFLNCLKSSASVDAQIKSIIDLQISAIAMVPDSAWAVSAEGSAAFAKTYLELAKTNGCVR